MAIKIYIDQGHNPTNPSAGAEGNGTSNASSLRERVDEANSWGADYFISIHTNASLSPSASGTEVLVYTSPSPAANLAEDILTSLVDATGLPNRGVKQRPGLYVLRKTQMPAVLVEMGLNCGKFQV